MVNAQPCTMGGIVDYGVPIGTTSSPRTLAVEKAQEELRQKCDVREEHRRELEFLEKGGNPLDFEFSHVATASGPSTSLTNQIAEQNAISEAKGSFAASPPRDSLESNDRPGSSLWHEINTTDSGGKSGIVEDKIVKRGAKRLNVAQSKQSLSTDSNKSATKTEDSGLSHLVVKSQAYVRRNRSKPSRESANNSSIRSSVPPAKDSEPRDEKGVPQRNKADEPVASIKPDGSYSDNAPKNTASDDQITMELDGFQDVHENDCIVQDGSKAEEVVSVETPGANSKVSIRLHDASASTRDVREPSAGDEKADDSHLDKGVGELDKKRLVPAFAIEDSEINKNTVNPPCEGTKNSVADHVAEDINMVTTKVDSWSHEDLDNNRHSNKSLKEIGQTDSFIGPISVKVNLDSVQPGSSNIHPVKDVMEVCDDVLVAQKNTIYLSSGPSVNIEGSPASATKHENCPSDPISACPPSCLPKNYETDAIPTLKNDGPNMENEIKKSENLDKIAHEDYVLRNALAIEATVKKAGERLRCNISLEERIKSQWDFVLEEMAWMANDFMQERLWKSAAAAQMCHWIASEGRAKFEEASIHRKQKMIMKSLAKGIMGFWCLAEASQTARRTPMMREHNSTVLEGTKTSGINADKEHGNRSLGMEESLLPRQSQIQDYAIRFLECNCRTADSPVLAEAPPTPDRLNDFGILKVSYQSSEENLFYTVPTGAMLAYRESVESLFEYHKWTGNTELMDECGASVCDSAADFPLEDTYEEEGETGTYLLPEACDGGFISKMCHKKKHQMHQRISGTRQYKIGTDVPYEPCLESKSGNRPLLSNGKRSSFLAVPAKRSRTAARQRVVSLFHASAVPHAKTDASSGDTNSLQDDESSLHGGSMQWRNMDYESTADFDRQLPCDAGEVSTKTNKKKKLNIPGYRTVQNTANSYAPAWVQSHMYGQRRQVEDYLKKRPESHHYNSNGIYVANGVQHASKKLKMMKQGIDCSAESSRVASQTSNMANPAKVIKIVANRKWGRKCKALKMTSIDGWSNFEDQALVVLVHDMGQNWELISDAINSIVRFKSIHRQPNECKERYKILDRSSADGADSADDSGSSQRPRNSLLGIPKGTARQLFERLQGPFEEENLKENFEKIIRLMQQLHSRHKQGNRMELKPIMQPHSSHVIALSQACVNKLLGGSFTPLDLCDSMSPNLDSVSPGSLSLGSHTNVLTLPSHQSSAVPANPTANLSSRLPGAPGVVLTNNLPSSSTRNTHRDSQKYGVPRLSSLKGDEQPKIQYNQVVKGRSFQQPGGSVPGAFPTGDHSDHIMPGAQMAGLNGDMPAAKAVVPRIRTPGGLAVSSGNLVPNSGHDVPGPVNFHPGGVSGPGNSILKPRNHVRILHNCRERLRTEDPMWSDPSADHAQVGATCTGLPFFFVDRHDVLGTASKKMSGRVLVCSRGHSMEEHKHMPHVHMSVPSEGHGHTAHISCINPSFTNVAASPPVQQAQQPQQMSRSVSVNLDHSQIQEASASPQQRVYALHLPEERQGQQRMVPRQNSDISGASAVSCAQGGSHIVQHSQGSTVNPIPCSQPQHQRQQTPQNPPDASSSPNPLTNATLQTQKKQGHQQSRQNLQQRNQGSQQAKLMKSLGRGNMVTPQTPPVDNVPATAVLTPSKKHLADKKLMQHGQGLPPANESPTPSMCQPMNQPKLYTMLPQSLKQLPDIGNQSRVQASSIQTTSDSQQSPVHSKYRMTTQQQQQQQQIIPSHNSMERTIMQQNCQMSSEGGTDTHPKQVQHNQMVPATSVPLSTDSVGTSLSVNQLKCEASFTSSPNLLNSPRNTSFANETLLTSPGQDVLQRQISGGFPTHSQVVGQWKQARQELQSQHQPTPTVQGSVFAPSNSSKADHFD